MTAPHPRLRPTAPTAILLAAGLIFGGAAPAPAQQTLLQTNYDPAGKTNLEVIAVLGTQMSRGFLPVRVTIRNATAIDRTWQISFAYRGGWNEIGYRSSFSVAAAAGAEAVQDLLVPVPTTLGTGSTYRTVEIKASSPGLSSSQRFESANLSMEWPALAMSSQIGTRNRGTLDSELSSVISGSAAFAGVFDPEQLPADWRGYIGLDALLVTDAEWSAADPAAKLAIMEWTRLGGRLLLYTTEKDLAGTLSKLIPGGANLSGNGVIQRGLGRIEALAWTGQDLNARLTVSRFKGDTNFARELAESYKSESNWPMYQLFGKKSFNPVFVVLLLIAYGVVVGPVNLFVLAGPGRRHRLFVTIPIIAVATAALILLFILFSDGIGGHGRRAVLASLEPAAAERRLYITQEQISRTGVLLGSGFEMKEPVFLSPVMIPPSSLNRLTNSRSEVASYSLVGSVFRGDWYQSRSEQGHFLQSVRPTRSRIELQAPSADGKDPPKLFSSLEFQLDEFYYRDDLGLVWKGAAGTPIAGGQQIALTPVDYSELEKWWKEKTGLLGGATRQRCQGFWKANGQFFAVSSDPRAGFIDTLDAIDWKDDLAIVHGAVLPAGTVPPPPAAN